MELSKEENQEMEKFNFRMSKLNLDMNNMLKFGFDTERKNKWCLDMARIAIEQNEFLNKLISKRGDINE